MRLIATDVARSVVMVCACNVCLSVCAGHRGEPCKTAEPMKIAFGGLTRVCPMNHVLDGHDPREEWAILLVVRPH